MKEERKRGGEGGVGLGEKETRQDTISEGEVNWSYKSNSRDIARILLVGVGSSTAATPLPFSNPIDSTHLPRIASNPYLQF